MVGYSTKSTKLVTLLQREIAQRKDQLTRIQQSYVLTNPERLYEGYLQRLDIAQDKLIRTVTGQIAQQKQQVETLLPRLKMSMQHEMAQSKQRFGQAASGLQLVSPLAVLGRGYSVTKKDTEVVRQLKQVALDDDITIQISDGEIVARVTEKKEK